MSETPERRVLKETISKMKGKNIATYNNYLRNVTQYFDEIAKATNEMKAASSKLTAQDKKRFQMILLLVNIIAERNKKLVESSIHLMDDMQLYIDVLESYSAELDNTLTEIFEKARKYAEEKEKEQQELLKKNDSASYVK